MCLDAGHLPALVPTLHRSLLSHLKTKNPLPLNQELTTILKRRCVLKEKNAEGYLSDL